MAKRGRNRPNRSSQRHGRSSASQGNPQVQLGNTFATFAGVEDDGKRLSLAWQH